MNVDAIQRALDHLKGEHDFRPFQSSGALPERATVRTIFEAEVTRQPVDFPGFGVDLAAESSLIRVRLVGSGFLKQMVRGIAGTLLQVGEERRDPGCTREILTSMDRDAVGPTAPGRALWLERVWYPEDVI